jgi:2-hydroxy-3-keto-5-methylthiopentenyl-1-phosphate phosphatase
MHDGERDRDGVGTVVVDFDGTIVDEDVSEAILQAFAPASWWEIDLEFQRGEIGSRECLVRQAALLAGRQEDMLRFAVETFRLDPTFPLFVSWARSRGMTVAVASDGLGFYVEPMLRAAGVTGVRVHANRSSVVDGHVRLGFPEQHPECRTCGVCKMGVVQRYRSEGRLVAFVGEGHTDRYGALYADVVFAKKSLPAICAADGVPFVRWTTFDDIRAHLEGGTALPGPTTTARCPGWP